LLNFSSEKNAFERYARGAPLYEAVKRFLEDKIRFGELAANDRIPSENEIVAGLGVSRMTANRALRELARDGKIVRVHGVGSFVAEPKPSSALLDVRNIADEIAARGHVHSVEVQLLEEVLPSPTLCDDFNIGAQDHIFHSVMVHHENGVPIQIENRFVNAQIAPEYLKQDFTRKTANAYLTELIAITETDIRVEAVLPNASEARQLQIRPTEPCLLLRRRTRFHDRVVTIVHALHPGARYSLVGSRAERSDPVRW
jgi:GntR family histidine utilization transcriptional repressor